MKCKKGCGRDVDGRKGNVCIPCGFAMKQAEDKKRLHDSYKWDYVDLVLNKFVTPENDADIANEYLKLSYFNNQQLISIATAYRVMGRLHDKLHLQRVTDTIRENNITFEELSYFIDEYTGHIEDKLDDAKRDLVAKMERKA